jgi:virginiamycin B lyase
VIGALLAAALASQACASDVLPTVRPNQGAEVTPATTNPFSEGSFPGLIASSAGGSLWFPISRFQIVGPQITMWIGRVAPDGRLTELAPPVPLPATPPQRPGLGIATGPGGNEWYVAEGKLVGISDSGKKTTEIPLGLAGEEVRALVAGPDGNLWLAIEADTGDDSIMRVSPAGAIAKFKIPTRFAGPAAIAVGPDGNLWFTEARASRIGRVTANGAITEFVLPTPNNFPTGVTAGPGGTVWFTEQTGVGRITTDNPAITEFATNFATGGFRAEQITAGPDGRLWFTAGQGVIGHITPSGRVGVFVLPEAYAEPISITAAGSALWFGDIGNPPCEGGGGTCMAGLPYEHGSVRKIDPGPLAVEVAHINPHHGFRRARASLACVGGNADEACDGRILLRHRRVVASRSFSIAGDTTKTIDLRLSWQAQRFLRRSPRHRLRAALYVTVENGASWSRGAVIQPRKTG